MGKNSLGTAALCGIALLLIIGFLLLDDNTPIALSKNVLFKVRRPEQFLELPGKVTWAEDGAFYNLHKGILRKLDIGKETLWERPLAEDELLWMGPSGILTASGNTVKMWDKDNNVVFEKADFLDDIRVLSVEKNYWLLSGKISGKDHVILINTAGTVLWYTPISGKLISANVHSSGVYVVLNLIDEKLSGNIVLIGSGGAVLWEKEYPVILFQVKVLKSGIVAIAEDRVFLIDYEGKPVWEYAFSGPVIRGDIGDDGYTVALVRESTGKLNAKDELKILMLSREGKDMWTYGLDSDVDQVKKGKDFVYIVDGTGILVLSREGLLTSKVDFKGVRCIEEIPSGDVIAVGENESSLIKLSDGR